MKKTFSFIEIILYVFFLSIIWFFVAVMLKQFLWLWDYLQQTEIFRKDFNSFIISYQNLVNKWYKFYQMADNKLILSGNWNLVQLYCQDWLVISGSWIYKIFSWIDCKNITGWQYSSWYWIKIDYNFLGENKILKLWYY